MKHVYILRHGPKDKFGNLTEEGKEIIQRFVGKFGNFQLVLSSEIPRAQQTALLLTGIDPHPDARANVINIAHAEEEELFALGKAHPLGIAGAIFDNPRYQEMAKSRGQSLVDLIQEVLLRLADNEKALIISHDAPMAAAERILKGLPLDRIDHGFQPLQGFVVNESLKVKQIS